MISPKYLQLLFGVHIAVYLVAILTTYTDQQKKRPINISYLIWILSHLYISYLISYLYWWDQIPRTCHVFTRFFTLNTPCYFLNFAWN